MQVSLDIALDADADAVVGVETAMSIAMHNPFGVRLHVRAVWTTPCHHVGCRRPLKTNVVDVVNAQVSLNVEEDVVLVVVEMAPFVAKMRGS